MSLNAREITGSDGTEIVIVSDWFQGYRQGMPVDSETLFQLQKSSCSLITSYLIITE